MDSTKTIKIPNLVGFDVPCCAKLIYIVQIRKGHQLRTKRFTSGVLTLAIGAVAVAVPSTAAAKPVTLVGSGSSAAQSYVQDLFAAYHRLHPSVSFTYNADGGNAGVKDVQAGRSQFAIQTSQPSASAGHTVWDQLFLDAVTIDVNKANSLSSISIPTTADIFLGLDTAWSSVHGSNLKTTIDPVGRNSTAGLYTIFSKAVLGGQTQSSNVSQQTSDGLVANQVGKDGNAIGYIGLANSHKPGIKPLKISTKNGGTAYAPNVSNIRLWAKDQAKHRSGGYPLTHFDWVVLPQGKKNATVDAFFSWVIKSAAAGSVLNRAGAVPYFNK
jgi:phosphate transport system substrate-binding protein